jgi:hypothetical protein
MTENHDDYRVCWFCPDSPAVDPVLLSECSMGAAEAPSGLTKNMPTRLAGGRRNGAHLSQKRGAKTEFFSVKENVGHGGR